jgi:transcriptional regulator with XRE-family HTH domain
MERAFPFRCEESPELEVDRRIGERIRARRMALGVSQSGLARVLGVSFQQVQKYENGMNRIGAGRLAAICRFLRLEPNHLFERLIEAPLFRETPEKQSLPRGRLS